MVKKYTFSLSFLFLLLLNTINLKASKSYLFYSLNDSIPKKIKKVPLVGNLFSTNLDQNKNRQSNDIEKETPVSKYKNIASELILEGVNYMEKGADKFLSYNLELIDSVLDEAENLIGTPYKYGGTTKAGIDCSAFIQKIFEPIGYPIPRKSKDQAELGLTIKKEDLTIGDLIFFNTQGGISHVGIVSEITDGVPFFIHASSSKGVTKTSLLNSYWAKRYVTAKRLPQG